MSSNNVYTCQICNQNSQQLICEFVKIKNMILCQDCYISDRAYQSEKVQILSMILDDQEIKGDRLNRQSIQYNNLQKELKDIFSNTIEEYDKGLEIVEFRQRMAYKKDKSQRDLILIEQYKREVNNKKEKIKQQESKRQLESQRNFTGFRLDYFYNNLPQEIKIQQPTKQNSSSGMTDKIASGYDDKQQYQRGINSLIQNL